MNYRILKLFIYTSILVYVTSCVSPDSDYLKISGFIQGTTYHITYLDPKGRNLKPEIESLLKEFDQSLSTYEPNSVISRINRNETGVNPDKHFIKVYNKSLELYKQTDGLFDVTVAPLVNAWGFGFTDKTEIDKKLIDSLLSFVGMEKVKLNGPELTKNPGTMFDFNAIAQGYSVDLVSEYFNDLNINNYLVEIGGEIRTKGKNPKRETWKIGIDKPIDNNNIPGESLQHIIRVSDCSMATSGSYRKFFEKEGKKYSHFIDPGTGYPVYSNLLSVTIIAGDCMTADAYATAFMLMGLEKSKAFLKHSNLQAYMIFSDNDGNFQTYATDKLNKMIKEVK